MQFLFFANVQQRYPKNLGAATYRCFAIHSVRACQNRTGDRFSVTLLPARYQNKRWEDLLKKNDEWIVLLNFSGHIAGVDYDF